jgi:CheY-like chemotaxis protein
VCLVPYRGTHARVAQLDRASGYEPEGREFESLRAHHPSLNPEKKGPTARTYSGAWGMVPAMVRPCFLVIDREFPGSISTRKLVIETAKFNVVTAYTAQESLDTLRMFQAIHGVVLDSEIGGMSCDELVAGLKAIKPGIPVIAICGPGDHSCPGADYELESFDPRKLLELLRTLLPKENELIEKREEFLHRAE